MSALDHKALRQGALVSLIFAVPFAVGSALMGAHDKHSPWTSVLWLGALAGFTLGAGIASWVQENGYPLVHGLFCAGGTYHGEFQPTGPARVVGDSLVIDFRADPAAPTRVPVVLRYAWAMDAQAALVNDAGLPATPFELRIK